MDSHLYRNVNDENPYTKKWIVICTEMCMTKTNSKIIWIVICTEMCITKTHMNRHSHLYRNAHDENLFKKNMDSHWYTNVHDENPIKKNMDSHLYRNMHDENPHE